MDDTITLDYNHNQGKVNNTWRRPTGPVCMGFKYINDTVSCRKKK